MFCQNCGDQIEVGKKFCSNCGAPVAGQNHQQQSYQQPQPSYQPPVSLEKELPMKWYKFLIYFVLFASAILNLASGIQFLNGTAYGGEAELLYDAFDGLRGLDMLIGVVMILMAVFSVYTRFRLSKFCKDGPVMLMILYAVGAITLILYMVGLYAVLPDVFHEALDSSSIASSTCMSIAMIFANKKYFDKRKHLFVN